MRNRTRANPCCRDRTTLGDLHLLPMGMSRLSSILKVAVAWTLDLFTIATQGPRNPRPRRAYLDCSGRNDASASTMAARPVAAIADRCKAQGPRNRRFETTRPTGT